ncbi:hypothetical protein NB639_01310 [Oxalobacter formigenes]|uniref:hypothetical protein n=1 Tax=Oxalobacter formigenes TaxID=847 RepID=UPI0022B01B21|nr:hypothetical protein [Oxalobacter formigenes]WAW06069.1 hypothetical protein NB639_01310 [Oxalobacter formigenes]
MMEIEVVAVQEQPKFKEQPESDPLAKKWAKRIENAKKHYKKFHKRIKHNRQLVSGLDWDSDKDPDSKDFYKHRANLIHSTITGMLPNLYARNPEISVSPIVANRNLKVFCKTLETVTNRYLEDAQLKTRAKSTVRAAMTCSFGILKVIWQQDIERDPLVDQRIQDAQDNLKNVERLLMELEDESARTEQEALKSELEQTIAALSEQVEVVSAEGIVIDRVLTENLLVDPSVQEFSDYLAADWITHIVQMSRQAAEGLYGYKLDKATTYNTEKSNNGKLFGKIETNNEDAQVCILEIWDKQSQRVYTMAEGCDFWLREPYSPDNAGERWYPFFLLPFQLVDGCFIGPSIVDLTERLQDEHNTSRDRYNEHRDLIKPGYIASADINEKTLKRFTDSELGEIILIDAEGKPINQAIIPKQHPPIDQAAYDVSQVRIDWEMVTGMQDAARSTVVKPKTATEANIMQQSLSARVSEFRDQIEDFLQQIAQYTAEILLLTIDPGQVEKIMGANPVQQIGDPLTGLPMQQTVKTVYDWPDMPKDDVFDLVQLKIRAGTTGAPDKIESQENWLKMIQVIQPMIGQIMQLQMQGISPAPLLNILKETINRFDDRLEVEDFIPNVQPPQQPQPIQQQGV